MVARSAFGQLKLVCQLCPFLEMSDLATVTHALVTSHLDYCNMLFVGNAFEDGLEASAGAKLCSQTTDWSQLQGAYNVTDNLFSLAQQYIHNKTH